MNTIYEHIEPYTELELDCAQNLYVTLIKFQGYEERYLGAVWPWEFILNSPEVDSIDKWKVIRITNSKCVNQERLEKLYKARLIYYYPDSVDEMWEKIKDSLDRQVPVIAAVDQYYAHYHYPYIYKKQHGFHAVMPLCYDDNNMEIYCVSSVPRYKGTITYEEFTEGIKGCGVLWYAGLDFKDKPYRVDEEEVWNGFRNLVEDIKLRYENYCGKRNDSTGIIYTPDMINMLEELRFIKDDDRLLEEVDLFCDGLWGWSVGRKGKWLSEYLKMPFVKSGNNSWEECIELIEQNSRDWMLAYRVLFKGLQGGEIRNALSQALDKLYIVLERDRKLLGIL